MAGKSFTLEIVTPDRQVFSGAAVSLTAPGVEGGFGVLANHRPFISELDTGLLTVDEGAGARAIISISGGFLEVSQNHVIVLADTAELGSEVDRDRARDALTRARELLSHPTAGIDLHSARQAARRAESRIKASQG